MKRLKELNDTFIIICGDCKSKNVNLKVDICGECGAHVEAECLDCGLKYRHHDFKEIEDGFGFRRYKV